MNRMFLALALGLFSIGSLAQTITTLAGGGSIYPPNGNLATNCNIGATGEVCLDRRGNLFFATADQYLLKVDAYGYITIFAGNGSSGFIGDDGLATNAEIHSPGGVISDSKGNIYFADQNNLRIRKIDVTGLITTYAGTGILGYSGDNGPATLAELFYPTFLAIDTFDNIYVDEHGKYTIRKIDTLGIITTICGTPGVANYTGDGGPASAALTYGTNQMHVDSKNNLFFTDGGSVIRKIELSSGLISKIAGNGLAGYSGDNGPATNASFDVAQDVVVDQFGQIFVCDMYNNRIRQIDTFGIITTIVGDGIGAYNGDNIPATSAEIYSPRGLCLDSCGNLYISDNGNGRIRKVTFDTSCHFRGALSTQVIGDGTFDSVDVFPNPANEVISISSGTVGCDYYITNTVGKILWFGSGNYTTVQVRISQWPGGLYFLHAKRKDGTEMVKKVLKE